MGRARVVRGRWNHGAVGFSGYARLWSDRAVRRVFVAAFLARIPMMALPLVLTLVVVEGMGRSYAEAGLVAAAETVGSAVGSPWRGRLLDAVGLRRALLPSLAAVVVVYPLMAIATFWWLVPLAFLAGIFLVPIYALVRLSLAVLVPEEERRTAFALDSVTAEAAFIIGPAAGGALVVLVSPEIAIFSVGLCIAAAASVFWWTDPPIRSERGPEDGPRPPAGPWLTADVLFLFLVCVGAMAALMSTDLGIIAALRELDSVGLVGVVYLGWGASSLVGGLLYGVWHTSIRPSYLLLALGLLTIPVGVAHEPWALALATIPAGFLCAPTMTACTEWLVKLVSEERRGEASGWQGTAFTAGGAVTAPLIGLAIDHGGAAVGFAAGGAAAALIAVTSLTAQRLRSPADRLRPQ